MQNAQLSLLARPDTFFGVFQGISEDLGFHPNLLRIPFAGLLFWSPALALATYAALGALVFLTRHFFPVPGIGTAEAAAPQPDAAIEALQAGPEQELVPLAA